MVHHTMIYDDNRLIVISCLNVKFLLIYIVLVTIKMEKLPL